MSLHILGNQKHELFENSITGNFSTFLILKEFLEIQTHDESKKHRN